MADATFRPHVSASQDLSEFTFKAIGLGIVFGILFGGSRDWIADLSGFVFGFGLSFVVSPGGFARLREKLRHD